MADPIRQGFDRQRRNLILFSILLLFLESTGASIERLNFVVTTLTVEHTEIAKLFIWLILAYFILRYFQYMNELQDNEYKEKIDNRLSFSVPRRAIQLHDEMGGVKVHYPSLKDESNAEIKAELLSYDNIKKQPMRLDR